MKVGIITGDLINSSQYEPAQRQEVIKTLKQTLTEANDAADNQWLRFEMYRGDSIQIEVTEPEQALRLAILLRAALQKLATGKKKQPVPGKPFADIRLSVGIGEAERKQGSVVEADGEAYRLSGRSLDTMKKHGQKLIIRTNNTDINEEFEVACRFLDVLLDKWSASSAEVVFWLLKGLKDVEIAAKLGISQPAIHARKKVAGWEAIELMLQRYTSVINKTF